VRTDLDDLPAPGRHTPRWSFEPWISKDISNRQDTYDFVDGFRARGIPVGTVVLDSPWETAYNTFIPHATRYPDMPGMIADMHQRGVRVVLWVTQMTNEVSFDLEANGDVYEGPASNYEEGLACGYYLDGGDLYGWWKGRGAAVEFFNPHARAWWHRQQDALLNAGLDGWKLDFGESYIRQATVRTAEGEKPHQAYSERYYEDYLAYGRKVRGKEFVTMVRGWDESYDIPGRFYARPEHAPIAWMGDNRRDWIGLTDALDHMFISARAGYAVVGADLGGYLDRDDKNVLGTQVPFDSLNFARWTAQAALTPFMQLHGRGNLTPWTVPDSAEQTVVLYKYWATLHHALVPFFYSLAEEAHAGAPPVLRPIGEPASWPGDYRYTLGDALLVAPLLDASGKRSVALPAGSRWFDLWTGAALDGGTTTTADFSADRQKLPVYIREGAIIPMNVEDDVTAFGDAGSKGALTVVVFPSAGGSTFPLREDDDAVTTLDAKQTGTAVEVRLSATPKRALLRIRAEAAPTAATLNGAVTTVAYDAARLTAVVEVPASAAPSTVTLTLP
jgi:alpha-glucosidase (family GH31 glycosyl hydrolase)